MTRYFLLHPMMIAFLYSLIFLLSEYIYRVTYAITPIRNVLESYLYIFVFTIWMLTSKYRFTRFFIWLFFTMSLLANNLHFMFYQSWMNAVNYWLFFNEISEVINASAAVFPKMIIPILWAFTESLLFASLVLWRIRRLMVSDWLFWSAMLFICVRSFFTMQQHGISPSNDYSRLKANYFSTGYFLGNIVPSHLFSLSRITQYIHQAPEVASSPLVKNIILVVGESQNSQNMHVFGYDRETTPFLSAMTWQTTAIIKPTYSSGVMTAVALPTLFNAIEKPNGMLQIASGATNLFRLAHQQGYYSQFHTAQAERDMNLMNLLGQQWIDEMTYPTQQGYLRHEHRRDDTLLPYLYDTDLDHRFNLIVLHQRGSHVPYGALLSKNEKPFGHEAAIDNYDNTILHTDMLLQTIFSYLQARNRQDWILIFTSDHGQNINNDVFNHGNFFPANYSVPTFIYTPIPQLQQKIVQELSHCKWLFHHQIATLMIQLMGFETSISDCKTGYVNGNLLSGDAGYLEIDQESGQVTHITGQ